MMNDCWLKFWGVRGSIPTPGPETVFYGGNTSCVEVRGDGEIIILDAGTGIRPLGLSLAKELNGHPAEFTLLITHTHWDHIQGLPFFQPAYDAKNHLRILGHEGACRSLGQTIAGQMESPYFPIAMDQMPGNIRIEELQAAEFFVGNAKVQTIRLNHPGIAIGYRIFTSGGSVAYMPDNEPATDCAAGERMVEFLRGCDVLIADSQYDETEYTSHVGWGHGCVNHVVDLAIAAGVQTLYLFHHDPAHGDDKVRAILQRARDLVAAQGAALRVEAAREGEKVPLEAKP